MAPRLLTTQEAAERLGLTPGSLLELRWQDDGLPILQKGLDVHYRLEDLEAFEQRELRKLLQQVLLHDRPLPLLRSIARSLDLAVNTQGVESEATVFRPAVRQDLKPGPKVKGVGSTPAEGQPTAGPAPAPGKYKPASVATAADLPPARTPAVDLNLPPNATWYLVHTKAWQEETAITNLQRQNFRCYMPMLYLDKIRRSKPVVVAEPMFPSYVFVQLDATENAKGQSWSPIRSTLGVRDLVKFGGQPAKVDADLVKGLHEREQLQQANPKAIFAAGDKVLITDGPFAGIAAIYQTTDAERRSMILLSMLNKPVSLHIEPDKLRKCA